MTKNVVGLYDHPDTVSKVLDQLAEAGLSEQDVEVLSGGEDIRQMARQIADWGVRQENARIYAQAVQRGKVALNAHAPDDEAEEVIEILNRNGARHVDDLAQELGLEDNQEEAREEGTEMLTLPESEEKVSVGKQKVPGGKVQVSRKVMEKPVEETVELSEENIEITHHPSQRLLSEEEAEEAFKEETQEFTETREVPRITREAQETSRVEVSKGNHQRKKTVSTTARKSEVEVKRSDQEEQD